MQKIQHTGKKIQHYSAEDYQSKYSQYIKRIEIKRLLKYEPEQVEVLLLNNALLMGDLENLYLSPNKKYLIAHKEEFDECLTPNLQRKFDVIIVTETRDYELFQRIFERQVWQGEQQIIKGNPEKVKLAALNDSDLVSIGSIRRKYNIPGPQDFQKYNDKQITYDMVGKYMGVPKTIVIQSETMFTEEGSVNRELLQDIKEKLGDYPYFVKPNSGTGSRMVGEIKSQRDLTNYMKKWEQTGSSGNFILSELLDCDFYVIEALFAQGKLVGPVMIAGSLSLWHKLQIGLPAGGIILKPGTPQFNKYRQVLEAVIKGLGIINGGYCIQAFERPNGEPVLCEVNPRRSACLFNHKYKALNGLDWQSLCIINQWDYDVDIDESVFGAYTASVQFPTQQGVVRDIKTVKLPNNSKIAERRNFVKIGQKTSLPKQNQGLAAQFLLTGDDFQKLEADWRYLANNSPIIYDK